MKVTDKEENKYILRVRGDTHSFLKILIGCSVFLALVVAGIVYYAVTSNINAVIVLCAVFAAFAAVDVFSIVTFCKNSRFALMLDDDAVRIREKNGFKSIPLSDISYVEHYLVGKKFDDPESAGILVLIVGEAAYSVTVEKVLFVAETVKRMSKNLRSFVSGSEVE